MKPRTGIITGCGRGIGLATAQKIIDTEKDTILIGISKTQTDEINLLKEKYPNNFRFYSSDVTSNYRLESILLDIYKEFGRIDFAICNAGIRSRRSILESDIDLYRSVIEVNTISNINIAKQLIENNLREKSKLNLLFISSIVGSRGFDCLSTYAVSKSALEGFTKSAAVEYAKRKIQINCIAPGFIESSYADDFKKEKSDLYQWTLDQTPMGRWGKCDEVADLAIFLISEKNSYMTGAIIYCDGGWTAK
mgnify:CR=1 FL=1